MEHVSASLHCCVLCRGLLYVLCWYVGVLPLKVGSCGRDRPQDVEFALWRKCTVVKLRCTLHISFVCIHVHRSPFLALPRYLLISLYYLFLLLRFRRLLRLYRTCFYKVCGIRGVLQMVVYCREPASPVRHPASPDLRIRQAAEAGPAR